MAWDGTALLGLAIRTMIRAYQLLVSPILPPSCRYYPSCSHYAAEAVTVHGPWRGSWLALRRMLRCHPWGGSGYDPVIPPKKRPLESMAPENMLPGRAPGR